MFCAHFCQISFRCLYIITICYFELPCIGAVSSYAYATRNTTRVNRLVLLNICIVITSAILAVIGLNVLRDAVMYPQQLRTTHSLIGSECSGLLTEYDLYLYLL